MIGLTTEAVGSSEVNMTGTLSRDTSTGTGTSAHVDERLGAEAARPKRLTHRRLTRD